MKVFDSIEEIKIGEDTCVALGNFDGVHIGHQKLIGETVAKAKKNGMKSAVFTFSTHPRTMIKGSQQVKNITTQEDKVDILYAMGIDYVVNVPFTQSIMETDPIEFIENYLFNLMKMKEVFCGFNYRYGYKASGDTKLLRREGAKKGFKVNIVQPVTIDGDIVSSTLIRGLIKSGEMEEAQKFLGRTYHVGGQVVIGNQIGRKIGFPTLNLTIDEALITPPNGVYATNCIISGKAHPSITNIGVKPTIGSFEKNVETHIFDFDEELYGENIVVEFLNMVREEAKFRDVEMLSAQIKKDCQTVRYYHGI